VASIRLTLAVLLGVLAALVPITRDDLRELTGR
jgi:hypothetical protein